MIFNPDIRQGAKGVVITNFWSIVLDDHWSKKIYRSKMIVWWPVLYSSPMILFFHHLESCPRYVRTGQLGHGTPRRPEIIDDFGVYKWEEWHMCLTSSHFLVVIPFWYSIHRRVVKSKIGSLIREGPDARPSAYTPLGPLRRQKSGLIGLKWIWKRNQILEVSSDIRPQK